MSQFKHLTIIVVCSLVLFSPIANLDQAIKHFQTMIYIQMQENSRSDVMMNLSKCQSYLEDLIKEIKASCSLDDLGEFHGSGIIFGKYIWFGYQDKNLPAQIRIFKVTEDNLTITFPSLFKGRFAYGDNKFIISAFDIAGVNCGEEIPECRYLLPDIKKSQTVLSGLWLYNIKSNKIDGISLPNQKATAFINSMYQIQDTQFIVVNYDGQTDEKSIVVNLLTGGAKAI